MTLVSVLSGASQGRVGLRIRDGVSRELLVSFDLSPEQVIKLIQGTAFDVDAEVVQHPERIGKKMESAAAICPKPVSEEEAVDWARETHPGWETYEPRKRRDSLYQVVMRRWV